MVIIWIFTDKGFLSTVAYDHKVDSVKRSKRQIKSWGKNPVLVRARLKGDLEQIRPFWSKLRVEDDDSADYEFRAVVPRARWVDFVATKADEIDYGSHFKEVAQARSPGGKDEGVKRHSRMMQVWTAMAALQPAIPYSGNKWAGWTGKYGGKYYSSWGTGKAANTYSEGTGSLCSAWTEYEVPGRGEIYKRWCVRPVGHKESHDFGSLPATITKQEIKEVEKIIHEADEAAISTYQYDSTNPFNMPDTVEEMCKELLSKAPDDVRVDPSTPYYTYDLWCRAQEEFRQPLTAEEICNILDELAEDVVSTQEASNKYSAALDQFSSHVFDAEDVEAERAATEAFEDEAADQAAQEEQDDAYEAALAAYDSLANPTLDSVGSV